MRATDGVYGRAQCLFGAGLGAFGNVDQRIVAVPTNVVYDPRYSGFWSICQRFEIVRLRR